ncbi:ArsR/SmtB family transcription factor [Streptomyces odontomachi]|uniref:ArsR/SmtB family transcription factor n=1 Tax=Streptomyces odontomachi TaxID=2944940 RepID=UPI002109ECB9|nr:winged helix-turn-helix domain-containing protein [Streptomyces sp. ODS25]
MSETSGPSGDELLKVLAALGNPHRLRIVAALSQGRNYVSALAREIGMGRPLLHMHLQRLEAAGIVAGSLELSESGKAMKYYELTPFSYELTPEVVAHAAGTLTEGEKQGERQDDRQDEKRVEKQASSGRR